MGSKRTRATKRRNRNNASTPVQDYEYEMIDGNWTARPYGYCHKYHGFLTKNMSIIHKCEKKNCCLFKTFEQYMMKVNKLNQEQAEPETTNHPKFMTFEQYKRQPKYR